MSTTVTQEFEKLCDQEFDLTSGEAYEGLDREIARIKEDFNLHGGYMSSATGQAVKEAVLARFDRVLAAFDQAYLAKWRDHSDRPLTDEDAGWLRRKAISHVLSAAEKAEGKCNALLWEHTLFFLQYWREAGIEARERIVKVQARIEILKMQKNQPPVRPGAPPGPNPFAGLDSPVDKKASVLLEELRRCYTAGCWNACGILLRIATERALDAIEPACKKNKGLSNKLAYCSRNSQHVRAKP